MPSSCASPQIPLQVQVVQHGCHYHQPLPVHLSVGIVPSEQGWNKDEHRAGPQWVHPRLYRYQQGQKPFITKGLHPHLRHWLYLLLLVPLPDKGIFFVTRLKDNATYKLIDRHPVNWKTAVISDHIIDVSSRGKNTRLRRIGCRDAQTGKRHEFLTNHFRLSANTIADIYKERWQIEIFFRESKQNLHIKSFVGRSENAVLIQVYTTIIVYLLLAYQKFLGKFSLSIQQLFELVCLNLFGRDSLEELLSPRRRNHQNTYSFSLLALAA